MRVTVCELPHQSHALEAAWSALRVHARSEAPDMLVLPEFAFARPVWELDSFDAEVWAAEEAIVDAWLQRLAELGIPLVIGARPVTRNGRPFNEGFRWSARDGCTPLRSKRFLPSEPGGWETRWFTKGNDEFPGFTAGELTFGLNICTELWAVDTYARYAQCGVQAIISPRATAAATTEKWLAIGTVAAVRSGAFCLSSNRVQPDGACGGVGWIIDPDGMVLALTSASSPFQTVAIDLGSASKAKQSYPRYAFAEA